MECPNCKQSTEAGAAFCGNCGYPLGGQSDQQAYALAVPMQRKAETQALLAVLFGAIGLAGSVFMALLGLILGIAGLVMGTISRSGTRRSMSTVGIILSSLSLVAGLAVWTYAINHETKLRSSSAAAASGPTITANNLSTPCYSLGFTDKLNIGNSAGSCDMRAFNGSTLETSTDAYKVYASQSALTSASTFTQVAKPAIEKDVQANLPGYVIESEQVGSFAGSPDYAVITTNKSNGVTVAEAAVFHPVKNGDNIFVIVHAISTGSAGFSGLEAQWQWK
ncbi:MAG TPA: hypothetical protein VH234_05445 [Candidatus Saccharimonadales bacterium]|jgi:hypothetical protein|nr:hypothetical protein [Candidatus Saccharimonadales bacterium]